MRDGAVITVVGYIGWCEEAIIYTALVLSLPSFFQPFNVLR